MMCLPAGSGRSRSNRQAPGRKMGELSGAALVLPTLGRAVPIRSSG